MESRLFIERVSALTNDHSTLANPNPTRPVSRPPRKRRSPPVSFTGRHLVRSNGESVRKKARLDYDRAKTKLEQARREIERFKTEDDPAFRAWMHRTFGPLLTEMRELGRKHADLVTLIREVEMVAYYEEVDFSEAYRRVMRRREEFEVEQKTGNARNGDSHGEEDFDGEGWADGDEAPTQDDYAAFARAFEGVFGFAPPPQVEAFCNPEAPPPPPESPKGSRVKELYRILARKLHPDAQERMTPQKLEWWHETQEAYEENDEARLEMILGLCEMEEGARATHTSVSMLQRLTAQLKASLRSLTKELRRCRQDPGWEFSRNPNRAALEPTMRAEMEADVSQLRRDVEVAERQVKFWAREAAQPKRRGRRRGRRDGANQGMLFDPEDEGF